jgi:short subunit dehydrogenase-like uncharacterized protein
MATKTATGSIKTSQGKPYELVVFGATSFVGKILCDYLSNRCTSDKDLRWAIAGRSQSKLDALKQSLGPAASSIAVLLADAADSASLEKLCAQTRVVVSTVGPYALYGEPLIKACVESGTDYCDLTGEVQWIRRMIQQYETRAKQSGAKIVHCCGFDSIPSDMGVWFLQEASRSRFGKVCNRVKMRVKAAKGEFSGGTVASLMNVAKEAASSPALRKELSNPYSICSTENPHPVRQPDVKSAKYDSDFNAWVAPFVMAAINTRIVHRSNALSAYAYGQDFVYDEALLTGRGLRGWSAAQAITVGLGSFLVAAAIKPTRWALERFVLPAPGEGPSPEMQKKGYYDLRFVGTNDSGEIIRVKVAGDQDPGYGSTSKMLGQAGICLARDIPTGKAGGFWTPSTLLGASLKDRLVNYAGLTFTVTEK